MRFTIVTPVFNGMPWLPATMESVGRQRVEVEVEHLVVDGGSTDGSREWLAANASFIGRDSSVRARTTVRPRPCPRFRSATWRNVLGWLNADDLLEPGALGLVAHVFAEHPDAVAVRWAALTIGPDGEVLGAIAPPLDGTFVALLEYPTNLSNT